MSHHHTEQGDWRDRIEIRRNLSFWAFRLRSQISIAIKRHRAGKVCVKAKVAECKPVKRSIPLWVYHR